MGGRMSARRRRRITTIWLVVAAPLVGLAVTVGALGGNTERVTGMWVSARIADDGSARITEVIDYDFGIGLQDRHGIYRDVPGLSDHDADVTVTSDSAPAQFLLLTDRIRIGDPDQQVYGRHRYRIEYTLQDVAPNGKLAWDAVGTGWQLDLDVVKVEVAAPFALDGVRCVQGAEGSTSPCPMSRPSPGALTARVTERGTALWIGVESFRRYLADAGAQTFDAGQVELYTAWAVALGEIKRWSEAVKRSTVAPRTRSRYYSPALAATLASATAASATAPSSSSGSSGSGSVGGGSGGGGGGGSW